MSLLRWPHCPVLQESGPQCQGFNGARDLLVLGLLDLQASLLLLLPLLIFPLLLRLLLRPDPLRHRVVDLLELALQVLGLP
jgi:hypothetical protein